MDRRRIAIVGGTGPQGRGLAYRFATAGHDVTLGSRDAGRAASAAADLGTLAGTGLRGDSNPGAAAVADVVVLAIPFDGHDELVASLADELAGKVVVEVDEPMVAPPRWLLVLSAIFWLLASLVLLSLDATGAAILGYMVGFVLIFGGVDEFILMIEAPSWRWLHGLAGGLFVLAGIGALFSPFQTFGILALFIGWYLIIKGFFDVAKAIGFRATLPLWGLTLAVGVLEIGLGLWAVGYPGRSAWLLMIWAGTGALLRSIGDFVAAFTSREA